MQRVTGIGGVFFKAENPESLHAWYRKHFDLPMMEDGTVVFWWRDIEKHFGGEGSTTWSIMPQSTDYMGSKASQQVMINFRVADLDAMRTQLRTAGVEVLEQIHESEFGRFGWFVDPEGNRMELWQPPNEEVALMKMVNREAGALPVTTESKLSLREVNKENLSDIWRLKVTPAQERFVAHNIVSLAQGSFEPTAWMRAIYADDTPVGFAMMVDDAEKAEYFLWRFMIDHRYQKLGYGKRALQLIIDYVRTRPNATDFGVSCVPGDGSPCPFYEKMGFVPTGEVDDGEIVMKLKL